MSTIATAHVWLDDKGIAWIDDTNTNVIEVVAGSVAHGRSPEESISSIHIFSLARIHVAL